jgi:peptidoglycan-associated lipoprotein
MKSQLKIVIVLIAVLFLAACNKKVKETDASASNSAVDTTQATNPVDQGSAIVSEGAFTASDLESNTCLMKRVIYFDYDQDLLQAEYQAVVACHAKYLRDRPGARLALEGHADERGTREYNLGLGERRSNAVASAFSGSGADANRINAVSYGEERPLCLDADDSCWSKNRRVEIVYSVK